MDAQATFSPAAGHEPFPAEVLLCGGTGDLGRRIAARLAERRVTFRALVRPGRDDAPLRSLGAAICTGDLTDGASLASAGVRTVVTIANAISRMVHGERGLSFEAVDRDGNVSLVRAAVAADVERFVFVSMVGLTPTLVARSPFAAAKQHAERALRAAGIRSVTVRPASFQELWLGPETGIRPDRRKAVIFGRGRSPVNYVAIDDVAEACVRLATMDDPPAEIALGGPESLSRHEVVDHFERAFGTSFRRVSVPRPVLVAGARALRRPRPAIASILGLALAMDTDGVAVPPDGLTQLGIDPRPPSEYIAALPRAAAPT